MTDPHAVGVSISRCVGGESGDRIRIVIQDDHTYTRQVIDLDPAQFALALTGAVEVAAWRKLLPHPQAKVKPS